MNSNENFDHITDNDLYVGNFTSSDINNEPHQTSILANSESSHLKTSNVSWASLLEEEICKDEIVEYALSISQTITESPKHSHVEKTERHQNIDDIIALNYKAERDIDLLRHQSTISNHLRKIVNGWIDNPVSIIDIDKMLELLVWLQTTSEYFSHKLHLPLHTKRQPATIELKNITRSSYQFCKDKHECEFNYNQEQYDGCTNQHYVHNLVNEDITTLIQYLQSSQPDHINKVDWNQVKKTIETVLFVVGHMSAELANAEYYNAKTSKDMHISCTPKKDHDKFKKVTKNNTRKHRHHRGKRSGSKRATLVTQT